MDIFPTFPAILCHPLIGFRARNDWALPFGVRLRALMFPLRSQTAAGDMQAADAVLTERRLPSDQILGSERISR